MDMNRVLGYSWISCLEERGAEVTGPGGGLQVKARVEPFSPVSGPRPTPDLLSCPQDWTAGGYGTRDLRENCSRHSRFFNVD